MSATAVGPIRQLFGRHTRRSFAPPTIAAAESVVPNVIGNAVPFARPRDVGGETSGIRPFIRVGLQLCVVAGRRSGSPDRPN